MEQIESVRCSRSHEDAVFECDRIKFEHKLIHEHHFVPRREKGADHYAICCITCSDCYCHICGKILVASTDNSAYNRNYSWVIFGEKVKAMT
jgi:hypothetical protein